MGKANRTYRALLYHFGLETSWYENSWVGYNIKIDTLVMCKLWTMKIQILLDLEK
jgi:hypothetical protein